MRSQSASYHRYRFPPDIISHAVWLYNRFWRQQAGAGRDRLRFRHGAWRGQLHHLDVLMRGRRVWHSYAILNQPLTVLCVERRVFFLAATLGRGDLERGQ